MKPTLSVVILAGTHEALLARSIKSVLDGWSDHLPELELIVVFNGIAKPCLAILEHSSLKIVDIPRCAPGRARNHGISASQGDWILFLDDDAYLSSGYRAQFQIALTQWKESAVIGGPNLTPPGSGEFARLSGEVLASPLCTGLSSPRYRATGVARVCGDESVSGCNLLVRRAAIDRAQVRFHPTLFPNEENVLIQDLIAAGFIATYVPELIVYHERRPSLGQFLKQTLGYGQGRGINCVLRPSSIRPLHTLPAGLIASAAAVACGWAHPGWVLVPLAVYSFNLVTLSWALATPRAAGIALGVHATYFGGILIGLARSLSLRSSRDRSLLGPASSH